MPRRSENKRSRLDEYLAAHDLKLIDEAVWSDLQQLLAPISNGYLRKLLKTAHIPLAPEVEGVRQDSFEEAERTLAALSRAYACADAAARKKLRDLAIESKNHARWGLKRAKSDDEHRLKEEILLWIMTRLENLEVFEPWLTIRRRIARGQDQPIESESTPP